MVNAGKVEIEADFVFSDIKKSFSKPMKDLTKEVDKFKDSFKSDLPFQGWALSFMFAGQQMVSTFQSIWRWSTKVFEDISHSVYGNVTAFDNLNAVVTYLGFTIGQALEPIAAWLAPIIFAIAEWVSENEQLVRVSLIVLGILGVMFLVIGTGVLYFLSLAQAIKIVAGMWVWFTSAAGATFLAGFLPILGWIALFLAAFLLLWQTDLGGFVTFIKETLAIIWKAVSTALAFIFNGIMKLWKALVALFEGDFDHFLAYLILGVLDLVKGIITIVLGLGAAVVNMVVWLGNSIVDLSFAMIRLLIKSYEMFLEVVIGIGEKMFWAVVTPLTEIIKFIQHFISMINEVLAALGWNGMRLPNIENYWENFLESAVSQFSSGRQNMNNFFDSVESRLGDFQEAMQMPYLSGDVFQGILDNMIEFYDGLGDVLGELLGISDVMQEIRNESSTPLFDFNSLIPSSNSTTESDSSNPLAGNITNINVDTMNVYDADADKIMQEFNRYKSPNAG